MAEDDNKIKPKATLIKHTKTEGVPPQAPTQDPVDEKSAEKKKTVVVVKKKPVVKKVVVVHKEPHPEGQETPKAPTGTEKPAAPRKDPPAAAEGTPPRAAGTTSDPAQPQNPNRPSTDDRGTSRPSGGYQGNRPAGQGYQGSGYQGNRPAGQGYQGGGYQGNRPAGQGYQGNRPAGQGYQGNRPAGTGYQGSGYQGNRPAGQGYQGGGYQGNRPAGTGYQGNRPAGTGYQGNRPAGTGYQGNRPAGTGYQGNRPAGQGGYQGNRPAGTGYQGNRPFGNRPGMPGGPGRKPGPGQAPSIDLTKKAEPKKLRSVKKEKAYGKERQEQEKNFSYTTKKNQSLANPIPKQIEIMEVITVADLARKMNLKAADLISKLMSLGMMATQNEQIDAETASILAGEYGTAVKIVSLYEETLIQTEEDKQEDLIHRSPIVTIMGHVDHGKTKLLDAIRTADVAAGEHGGITQHIGAYQVKTAKGSITFLDTPGHEAFTLMRARGAQITDIVVLVVAANDGVMPQTIEAIHHAKEAKVPIIVAVNKVDLPEANPDRVRQQLSDHGLIPEAWGGSTIYCEISALKKLGLDGLLDSILLQAEVLELRASEKRRAEGRVIESKIDQGRGVVATVLVQKGILKLGDNFVGGVYPGRVRAMFNDRGEQVKEAGPSTPVEILGFDGIPASGDPFQVTASDREAKEFSYKRQELKKVEEAKNVKKINLNNLYDHIKEGAIQELKVIIKGDVHGSVEALEISLEKLSTAEIRLHAIHASAGAITEKDVYLASASNAIIIGFHVRPTAKVQQIADREKVEIRKYNIIYDAVEDIRSAMEGMLAPDLKEEITGSAEVRDTFKVPKIGLIAGCMITQGKAKRTSNVRVFREGVQLFQGKLSSLRRFKDDAKEVAEGYECGIGIDNFQDLQVGDILELYDVIKIAKKLGAPVNP